MRYSMRTGYATPKPEKSRVSTMRIPLLFAAAMIAALSVPADGRGREQDAAFKAAQQGRILSLREIESRVSDELRDDMKGARHIGTELDAGANRYRLKFMRGKDVMWVDVDARTGRIISRR
jgi:uncharacterized membrane protein YkoI